MKHLMISSQKPLFKYHMIRITALLFFLCILIVSCDKGRNIDNTRQAEYLAGTTSTLQLE
jgi:hypothetical protein